MQENNLYLTFFICLPQHKYIIMQNISTLERGNMIPYIYI